MTNATCMDCGKALGDTAANICLNCVERRFPSRPGQDLYELSKADQEALDRLECQACHLPGMKNGVCLFGHLHKSSVKPSDGKS